MIRHRAGLARRRVSRQITIENTHKCILSPREMQQRGDPLQDWQNHTSYTLST